MPDSAHSAQSSPLLRLPTFWQLQLIGWFGWAVVSIPLKQTATGSLDAAIIFSAYQLPLSLALSAGLRWFYQRTQAMTRRPVMFSLLVLAGSAAAGLLDVLVSVPVNQLLQIRPQAPVVAIGMYAFRPLIYLIWSLAYFLIKTAQNAREQSFRAAITDERHRLELMLYQLNPNFLARSLSDISHEISENPAVARSMTVRLAAFYKNTLRLTDPNQATTIGDELDLVRAYLDIEVLRRRGALKVNFSVDDSLRKLSVPPIMLLPLAEQAVKAGGTPAAPLAISVTAERTADAQVLLEVAHSGQPVPVRSSAPFFEVEDVRDRLEQLYPGHYRFTLHQDSFTTRATIRLPLHT